MSEWKATHRIEFRAGFEKERTQKPTTTEEVMLLDGAAWSYDRETGWLCEGQATPGGQVGGVTVVTLADAKRKSA